MSAQPIRRQGRRGAVRLTLLYIAALTAVAVLLLAGQTIVQMHLDRQMSDASVVNIAGRQRMLSQRIAKAALAAVDAGDAGARTARRRELSEALALWERSHRGLQRGDGELGLPGSNSPEVQRMFAGLEPVFLAMLAPARRLAARDGGGASSPQQTADVAEILRLEPDFLAGMDTLVSQYAAEASHRVAQVRRIERGLLLATLAVLVLEGALVFRPAVRRIRAMLAALEASGAKLAAARDAAENANRAKDRFLAVTSHELRTPLHAVLGIAEQLQTTPLDEFQRQAVAVLHGAGKTLLALVDDLLDIARIDSGNLQLRMQPVSLASLLDQVLALVRPAAEQKGLELSDDRDPDLPKAIVADPLRLRQVLLNLLGNAVKFTDRGHVRLSVNGGRQADGTARLRFSVIDTGIGIPPAEQKRVFESFAQVDASPSRSRGGVGLGLAISRRLVELLGGRLELTSEDGKGSCFSFTLSCNIADEIAAGNGMEACDARAAVEPPGPPAPVARESGPAASEGRDGPVLVVDDAPANRYLATSMLRGAGYAVDCVGSGEEAVRAIAAKTYRAVLLDVHMPGMDGFAVARTVRKYESDHDRDRACIIALTADTSPETRRRLLDAAVDAVLLKPASEDAVLAALANASATPRSGKTADAINGREARFTGKALARLRGDRALLAELTSLFAQEASLQQNSIERGLRNADAPAVQRASHRLRGQAMMFDAEELCRALAEMEDLAAAGRLKPCGEIWSQAAEELESLCAALAGGHGKGDSPIFACPPRGGPAKIGTVPAVAVAVNDRS